MEFETGMFQNWEQMESENNTNELEWHNMFLF